VFIHTRKYRVRSGSIINIIIVVWDRIITYSFFEVCERERDLLVHVRETLESLQESVCVCVCISTVVVGDGVSKSREREREREIGIRSGLSNAWNRISQ